MDDLSTSPSRETTPEQDHPGTVPSENESKIISTEEVSEHAPPPDAFPPWWDIDIELISSDGQHFLVPSHIILAGSKCLRDRYRDPLRWCDREEIQLDVPAAVVRIFLDLCRCKYVSATFSEGLTDILAAISFMQKEECKVPLSALSTQTWAALAKKDITALGAFRIAAALDDVELATHLVRVGSIFDEFDSRAEGDCRLSRSKPPITFGVFKSIPVRYVFAFWHATLVRAFGDAERAFEAKLGECAKDE